MSKRDDLKLDIISNLDEDVVEKNLQKRFELWNKKSKSLFVKRLIPIIAAAACFCLIFCAVLGFMFGGGGTPGGTPSGTPSGTPGGKQVPIYTGMTVSKDSPIASAAIDSTQNALFAKIGNFFGVQTLDNSNKAPNLDGNNGNHNGQIKHTDANGNVIEVEGSAPLFYATAGEDFYITVHIDNPDNFEIISFTLNGKKYSSYMFEEGSDMENLILECNAGEMVGLTEYAIDAIKYIDGETIKNVKIGGEQTIKVYLEKKQSSGLKIQNNRITGIGSCKDTELYLNLPVAENAFSGNTKITKVFFNENVSSIGSNAFSNCTSITDVVIGAGAEDICGELQEYNLLEGYFEAIRCNIFSGCINLKNITITEENATYHSSNNCIIKTNSKLLIAGCKNSIIPNNDTVRGLSYEAFKGQSTLESISIPKNIEAIFSECFADCTSLTEIVFEGTVEEWKNIKKGDDWNKNTGNYVVRCSNGNITKENS